MSSRKASSICAVILTAAVVLILASRSRSQGGRVFYVIGAEEKSSVQNVPKYKGIHLYEMDSAAHTVRSAEIAAEAYVFEGTGSYSGMLTGDRKTVVVVDGTGAEKTTFLLASVPDLKIQSHIDIPVSAMPTDAAGHPEPCVNDIFVHPVTSLTFFSCDFGRAGVQHLELDPFRKKVVDIDLHGAVGTMFLYDEKRKWMYLAPPPSYATPAIFDAKYHLIRFIDGLGTQADAITMLPDGNLMVLSHSSGPAPMLLHYDPAARKTLQVWKEERANGGGQAGPAQLRYELGNVPVPSRDGSHLFGIETVSGPHATAAELARDNGVLWDTKTLQILRRWKLPEPKGASCSQNGVGTGLMACFTPAPDGRGMWYFGQSGKIYRLDDHTGNLIEEVKLPFHFISLIREL